MPLFFGPRAVVFTGTPSLSGARRHATNIDAQSSAHRSRSDTPADGFRVFPATNRVGGHSNFIKIPVKI
jgi:hypothetical protein